MNRLTLLIDAMSVARCFAEFTLSATNGLSMTGYNLLIIVTLSAAKGLARGAPRCFALLSMTRLYLS